MMQSWTVKVRAWRNVRQAIVAVDAKTGSVGRALSPPQRDFDFLRARAAFAAFGRGNRSRRRAKLFRW